ncbi:MAG: ABC transporter ATP-binding protein [Aestuariivita sp.]|nr:ABC transporter ATP-binding protein [Aestuariivita sp.]
MMSETVNTDQNMPKSILSLSDIRRSFQIGPTNTEILKGVDLEVYEGDLLSIMGPSGSGKTTLMNIIGLLDQPSSGYYVLDGDKVSNLNDNALSSLRNKQIGFVFQAFHLLTRSSAVENVCMPLLYRGVRRKAAVRSAEEMLDKVGMGERLRHRPNQLSGGQKQRVAIARALVGSPSLLLADEPTGALDPNTAKEVMSLLLRLNDEQKLTVMIITHDVNIARQCKRQVFIRDGTLIESSEYMNAAHSETADRNGHATAAIVEG